MRLLRKVFFQLISRKLGRMRELHDEDAVVLRRTNRKQARPDNNGNLGRRLSWSISDLSRLPVVKTNSLLKTRCSRVRNASISSCSLSSGSSSFSLRSNGSFRRKARIPVSGFTERAFLANERKMIEDAEIIVREDFEPVVKAEVAAERLTENEGTRLSCNQSQPDQAVDKTTSLSSQSRQKTSSDVAQQGRKSCDVSRRKTTTSEDRESISSITSFSSSFVIDRIFHWRKSSSKSCKDSISISGGTLEEYHNANTAEETALDNDKQIDCRAARSLSAYNSVSLGCSSTAGKKLPLKPLRFHIKQLESVLSGALCPPPHLGEKMEVQLKLDSLRVMRSLEMMNKSEEFQSQIIYDFPRYLYG